MYRINCIKAEQGVFDVVEYHTKDYKNYWMEIRDDNDKCVGFIMQPFSDFLNKREDGFLTAKLGKAISKALAPKCSFEPAYYEWHLTDKRNRIVLNWVDPADNFFVSEDDDENDVYDELRPMTYDEVLTECEEFINVGNMAFDDGDEDYHGVSQKDWERMPADAAEVMAKRMFFYYCLEPEDIVKS